MNQLLVYSTYDTERLKYILNLILGELMGLNWQLTTSLSEATSADFPVLYYSTSTFENGISIYPNPNFLDSTDIYLVKPQPQQIGNTLGFFKNDDDVLGFDFFAASFFLVCRYEEYLPFNADKYGRFSATESLAGRYNFLDRPLVNEWIELFANILCEKFPLLKLQYSEYKHVITVDVDSVYSYRCKGFMRNMGGLARDILKFKYNLVIERLLTLARIRIDPFDVFKQIHQIASMNRKELKWFVLAANYAAPDNANDLNSSVLKSKIKELSNLGDIGVHPSFLSNKNRNILKSEIDYLKQVTLKQIVESRQHYLMLSFPDTYNNLLAHNITSDYSMGYADKPGFRASIATSFFFFNLKENKQTNLRVHPLIIMDRTFVSYNNDKPDDAFVEMDRLRQIVKRYNGQLFSLWHNITLANNKQGRAWMNIFRKFIETDL